MSHRRRGRRETFLPFGRPDIGDAEIAEVVDTLRSGWITSGPKTRRFEAELAGLLHAPAALALSSCTAGLHTALATLGVKAGDEVITAAMTFAATVNVIEQVGAKPVLVDIEHDTLTIDPAAVEAAITRRTRAIIPVHYAGHPAEMDAIRDLARARSLLIIEDAAHALSAKYRGRPIGSEENLAAFSFHATKNITTAEGGLLTGKAEHIARARVVSQHGISRSAWERDDTAAHWYYQVLEPGFKYNMTDLQAALGLAQLRRFPELQRRRREIVATYTAAFASEPALEAPVERPGVEHAWHLYVLRIHRRALRIDRDQFIDELEQRNIGASVHFIPIHLHPYYRQRLGASPRAFPVTYDNFHRVLSLPLSPAMSDADVSDVIDAVLDTVSAFRR